MNRSIFLNALLLVILLVLWAVILIGRYDPTKRNFRVIPQMEDSLAFETQQGILPTNIDKGRTPAVPGTIPRGFKPLPFPYSGSPVDAERAGRQLHNPYRTATDDPLKRGAFVYSNFCAICHGQSGLGDCTVVKRGVPAPPSLFGQNALTIPDGRMFHILAFGQGTMPSYSSQISQEDRWKVILYVHSLQKAASTSPTVSANPRVNKP